jgi:PAS domain S-box-containing protein
VENKFIHTQGSVPEEQGDLLRMAFNSGSVLTGEKKKEEKAPGIYQLIEAIPGMALLYDINNRAVVYANYEFYKCLELDINDPDVIGEKDLLFGRINPLFREDADEFTRRVRHSRIDEEIKEEFQLMSAANEWKDFELKAKIFRKDDFAFQCLITCRELMKEDLPGKNNDPNTEKDLLTGISHEFRTPITLIRGTLEQMQEHLPLLPQKIRGNIDLSMRNTLRLQKMVNTLLDFSRIGSGQVQPSFKPVDICTLTNDIAAGFRPAIERSGMELHVKTEEPGSAVYVDKEMWEKIVLNLISNAFKYSYKGRIEISLRRAGKNLNLTVLDTGIGIPVSEQKKIFDRFYSIQNVQARSGEGAGIGLTLAKELVKLHKGSIKVKSKPGIGSVFIVSIPLGKEHLPKERVSETFSIPISEIKDSYVAEVLKWVPGNQIDEVINDLEDSGNAGLMRSMRPCVLLVEDNPDMRDYLKRLLSTYYRVALASGNESALNHLRQFLPDVVLCNVGGDDSKAKELLAIIKDKRETSHIPVMMMSSKAGEDTRIEYINEGADDYMLKPFSAKELLSRIGLTLKVARTRRISERNLRNIIMQAPVGIVILNGEEMTVEEVNDNYLKIMDQKREAFSGKPFFESLPYLKPQLQQVFSTVLSTGTSYTQNELMLELRRYGRKEKCYFNIVYHPLREEDNSISGIMGVVNEITSQVMLRKEIEESEERFKMVADTAPVMVWMTSTEGKCTFLNKPWSDFTGIDFESGLGDGWTDCVHPEDRQLASDTFREAIKNKSEYTLQFRLRRYDGVYRWIYDHAVPRFGNDGDFLGYIGSAVDIHEQKASTEELEIKVARRTMQLFNTNLELKQSNEQLEQFAYIASHDLQEPLRKIRTYAKLIESSGQISDDSTRLYLSRISASSNRMSDLIRDILNYSRLSKYDDLFTDTDLNRIIENIKTDFELIIHEKNVVITYEKLPVIKGIPHQLEQLFTNIISNSIKFSSGKPEINIKVTMANEDDFLDRPQLKAKRAYWKIIISDNGIGFDQKYAEKIFTIFQRLNSNSQYEGTGIGLALCRKIVANHKGVIYATGQPGVGACFTILLPV